MAEKRPGSVTPDQILKQLEAGQVQPLYFFHAGERPRRGPGQNDQSPYNTYLLDRLLDAFRQAVVGGNPRDLNFTQFIGGESDLGAVLAVARTYPMMRPKRLVIVKDAHQFKAADWTRAESYFNDPAPSTVLVLVGEHLPTSSKGGAAALKLVKASCLLVPVEPFARPQDLAPYLSAELKRRRVTLDKRAEALLLDLLGTEMTEILGALDKLELFAGERTALNSDDVQHCVSRTRGDDLWGFQDAVAERNLPKALGLLGRLTENARPEEYLMLVGSLVRHVRGVAEARRLLDRRLPKQTVLSSMAGSPYANRKRLEQAERHSASSLATLLGELETLDRGLHSSRIPPSALFERFVIRSCSAR